MNQVYFTCRLDGAGLAAEIAVELAGGGGTPRDYEVEPTGAFGDDPNVTDTKFPRNPTRSFRTPAPLRVVREVQDFPRLTPEALMMWRERLVNVPESQRGEILN